MRKPKTIEEICIRKIESGIRSIRNGNRSCEDVYNDIEFVLERLKHLNKGMYLELFGKLNIEILKAHNKEIKDCV